MKKKIQKYLAGEREGFSLVELIIVIAIMAILIGVIALAVIPNIQRSRESKDISMLDSIASAANAAIANNQVSSGTITATIYKFGTDGKMTATGADSGTDTKGKIAEAVRKTIAENPTLGSSSATSASGVVYVKCVIPTDGAAKITVAISDTAGGTPRVTKYLSEPSAFVVNN